MTFQPIQAVLDHNPKEKHEILDVFLNFFNRYFLARWIQIVYIRVTNTPSIYADDSHIIFQFQN